MGNSHEEISQGKLEFPVLKVYIHGTLTHEYNESLTWCLLSPPFYRYGNRFKKVDSLPIENKNPVLFSTVYLEASTLPGT